MSNNKEEIPATVNNPIIIQNDDEREREEEYSGDDFAVSGFSLSDSGAFGEGMTRTPVDDDPEPSGAGQQGTGNSPRVYKYKLGAFPSTPSGKPLTFSDANVNDAIAAAAVSVGVSHNTLTRFANIESSGRANASTGSYHGLFQLSYDEFNKYGKGDIYDPYANALAEAHKLKAESDAFRARYGREATAGDLYLIHQQGAGGAAAHWNNPDRPAWENMASTAEGRQKGGGWAKTAIWGNVPDSLKPVFGSVDNVTSADFAYMWAARIDGETNDMVAQNLRNGTHALAQNLPDSPTNSQYASLKTGDTTLPVSGAKTLSNKLTSAISSVFS